MAQRRNRTNGRFTKSTRRRRTKPKTNLTNLAVSGLVANSITEGLFRSNIVDFVTGRMDGAYKAGADGSLRLTLPELLGISGRGGFGGTYASGYDLQSALKKNISDNGGKMLASVILIPMVAKVVTKVIRKPIILPVNRMLKTTGLDVKV